MKKRNDKTVNSVVIHQSLTRSFFVREVVRNLHEKVSLSNSVLSHGSRGIEPIVLLTRTHVLSSSPTVLTSETRAVHPSGTHSITNLQVLHILPQFLNDSHSLVPRNEGELGGSSPFASNAVHIGVTNAGCQQLDQHFAALGLRNLNLQI